MTAPDPGLTGLIAAHREFPTQCVKLPNGAYAFRDRCKCGWAAEPPIAYPHRNWYAHLASVVEQHTNGRIAEYIKQLESERETLTSMCSELESIRDEQAARIAELETLQRVDQDLFVQTLAIANQRKERAEKAEATIARVRAVEADYLDPEDTDIECREDVWRFIRDLRAALEGVGDADPT